MEVRFRTTGYVTTCRYTTTPYLNLKFICGYPGPGYQQHDHLDLMIIGLFGPLSLSTTHRYPKVPTVPYAGVAPAPAGHQPAAYSTASSSLHTYYLRHVLVLTHGSRSNRSPMMTDEYMPRGRGEFPAAESSGRPSLWPRTNS
jgi:hypothetical protein